MASYFDPSMLNDFDFIVFGPFWGDLYWEYAKWQSFIRWYTLLNPDKTYEIWTRKERVELYTDIKATIYKLESTSEVWRDYEPEGYKLKNFPEDRRLEVMKAVDSIYTEDVCVYHPPYVDRADFFNPKQMNMDLFFNNENYRKVNCIVAKSPDKRPITLFPPLKKDSIVEDKWQKAYENIAKVGEYIVFVVGEGNIIKPKEKYLDFYLAEDETKNPFGFNICAMVNSEALGGVKDNLYLKISKHIKFLKTYSIQDKNSIKMGKFLKGII